MGDVVSLTGERHPTVYTVTATCDRCGKVETWEDVHDPHDTPEPLLRGYPMNDPESFLDGRWLWFCSSVCVHAYIDDKVILGRQRELTEAANR